jgi:methyl-accepting chemotaxis protein
MTKHSSLERKMLSYFGLIAAASLLITLEFVYAIQAATPAREALGQASGVAAGTGFDVVEALNSLRNKAMLMCVVQAVVTLIVLIMFMRRITGPLQHMVECARVISEGDLSRTINIRSMDEIGLLGETVNGLTSNVQEIVAFGRSTVAAVESDIEGVRSRLKGDDSESRQYLNRIESNLEGFDDLMSEFTLLAPPTSSLKDGDKS